MTIAELQNSSPDFILSSLNVLWHFPAIFVQLKLTCLREVVTVKILGEQKNFWPLKAKIIGGEDYFAAPL